MGSVKSWFGKLFSRLRSAYSELVAHRYTTIAGTLTFFLVTSLVPLLFWLTLLFGRTAVDAEVLEGSGLFGWAEDLIVFLGENAASTAGTGVFFLGTTLWSASGFFYHLRRSGEIVYDCRREKKGWKVRLSAFGLTFCVLFFLAGAGGALVTLTLVSRRLPRLLSQTLFFSALLVLGFFAAWLLNAYICPYRCKPRDTVPGSLLTSFLWLAASAAFAVYTEFAGAEKLYGALALVIVFLLWLYWMMVCFTAGTVLNRVRMRGKRQEHKKL